MAQPGYQKTLQIKTTGSTSWGDLPANAASMNLGGDILDDTDFSSTGIRSRILGIRDWNISGTIYYDDANTVVNTLRSAWLNRTRLDIRYLPNGTNGFTGQGQIEAINLSGSVNDLEVGEFTIQADGQLTTV